MTNGNPSNKGLKMREYTHTPRAYTGKAATVHSFDDISELCDAIQYTFRGGKFTDDLNYSSAIKELKRGNLELATQAMELMAKIDTSGLEFPRPTWEASQSGAFPNVPAFLAGEVDCMNTLTQSDDQSTPVRIFASLVSSSGVKSNHLKTRGAAILALAMLIKESRPLELYIYSEMDSAMDKENPNGAGVILCKVNTAPLDISQAAAIFCSQGMGRGIIHEYHNKKLGWSFSWAFQEYNTKKRLLAMREVLGASPQDIVLSGAYLTDECVYNPLGWIKSQLDFVMMAND